ncbi:MAG: hypothetical protein RL711_1643 [Bacteroidota bacterium]|jgi:hypothetical protein
MDSNEGNLQKKLNWLEFKLQKMLNYFFWGLKLFTIQIQGLVILICLIDFYAI